MLLPSLDLTGGTLIQIGAGTAPGIEDRLLAQPGPARVILVEPHPQLARALSARLRDLPQVSVLAAAIGADDTARDADLHTFSDRAHCSLRPALPLLHELLPGLKADGVLTVAVLSAGAFLAGLGDLPHPVHLEIDAPGSARDILAGLKSAGCLDQIDTIDLRTGAEPLYQGAAASADLAVWMRDEGFHLLVSEMADPDWPELRMGTDWTRRKLERQVATLTEEAAAQVRRITTLEEQLSAAESASQQHESLSTGRAAKIVALESDLQARQKAAARQTVNNGAQIRRLQADLASAGQAATRDAERIADLEGSFVAAQTQADEQAVFAGGQANRIAELEAALAERDQTAGQIGARLLDLDAEIAVLKTGADANAATLTAAEANGRDHADRAAAGQAKVAELEKALDAARQDIKAGAAALEETGKRAERVPGLEAEVARQKTEAAQNAAARTAAETRAREQADLAIARHAKLAELEAALATVQQMLDTRTTALGEAEKGLAATQRELAQLKAETAQITTARQSAEAKAKDQSSLAAARQTRLTEVETALAAAEARTKAQADLAAARQTRLTEVETTLAAAEARAKAQSGLAATRQTRLTEVETALAAAQATAKEQSSLAAARQTRLTEVETALAAAEATAKEQTGLAGSRHTRLSELEAALGAVKRDLQTRTAALDAAEQRAALVAGLEAEGARLLASAEGAEQKRARLAAETQDRDEKLAKKVQKYEQDLLRARQDLGLAVKVQVMARDDLRDLQSRFSEVSAIRDEQEALLRKLTPRLQEAALQLRDLMALPAPGTAPQPIVATAKSGPLPKSRKKNSGKKKK